MTGTSSLIPSTSVDGGVHCVASASHGCSLLMALRVAGSLIVRPLWSQPFPCCPRPCGVAQDLWSLSAHLGAAWTAFASSNKGIVDMNLRFFVLEIYPKCAAPSCIMWGLSDFAALAPSPPPSVRQTTYWNRKSNSSQTEESVE
jgi:hypothetical protein